VTDIAKDGAMSEINTAFYEKLMAHTDMDITASGGVTRLDDLVELKKAGLAASIFHLGEVKIKDLKQELKTEGILVRV
jgi:imidazole glycerol phosphate synthase subunit hisF